MEKRTGVHETVVLIVAILSGFRADTAAAVT